MNRNQSKQTNKQKLNKKDGMGEKKKKEEAEERKRKRKRRLPSDSFVYRVEARSDRDEFR